MERLSPLLPPGETYIVGLTLAVNLGWGGLCFPQVKREPYIVGLTLAVNLDTGRSTWGGAVSPGYCTAQKGNMQTI